MWYNRTHMEVVIEAEEPQVAYLQKAQELGWEVTGANYPEVMHITGTLEAEMLDTEQSYLIGAFVGEEFRGADE